MIKTSSETDKCIEPFAISSSAKQMPAFSLAVADSGQVGKSDWFELLTVIVSIARKTKALLYGRINVTKNLSATGLMHLAAISRRPNIFTIDIPPDIMKFTEPYVLMKIFYIFL